MKGLNECKQAVSASLMILANNMFGVIKKTQCLSVIITTENKL